MSLSLQYVAGLFDGEGSVGTRRSYAKWKGGARLPYYQATAQIANSNSEVIYAIQRQFGGYVSSGKPKKKHWRTMYRWGASCKIATDFLEQILPYLVIKKRQAELALEFRGLHGPGHETRREEKLAIRMEIMRLNGRHKPAA